MRLFAGVMMLVGLMLGAPVVDAGIAPNTGGSAMTQSGARIAPAKPVQERPAESQDTKQESER